MAELQRGESLEALRERYLEKVRAVEAEVAERNAGIDVGGVNSPGEAPNDYTVGINYKEGNFYFNESSFTPEQLRKYPNMLKDYANHAVAGSPTIVLNTSAFQATGRIVRPSGTRSGYVAAMCQHIQERGGVRKSELFDVIDQSKFTVSLHNDNPDELFLRKDMLFYLDVLHSKAAYALGVSKLHITSSYRSPYYNYNLYSTRPERVYWSPHMGGIGVDIATGSVDRSIQLAKIARSMGFGGVGVGDNFVHIDIGPYGSWHYGNAPEVD